MSSRALRRLQQLKEETKGEDEEALDEEVQPVKSTKKKNKASKSGNIFDLLGDENENDNELVNDQKNGDNDDDDEIKDNVPVNKTKSKKKRNKKKGKNTNVADDDELDEIDRTVMEINEKYGGAVGIGSVREDSSKASSSVFKCKSILLVDPRNLNPINEMKRKFGANVVNANRRRDAHTRRFKRVTSLVTPKDNWPPYTKVGITMNQVKSDNGAPYFVFEHQEMYRNVQFKFYDALESMDHNNIIALLNAHPYHIDSMLQLSEIFRMQEDHRMAGELIERSLFVFECAFHTLFNITQGNCRLDYKRAENRPFFLALYRHITYIGDRACYRTALEFCKVLFGLDPVDDPLGILLMIDYYAIKSEEFSYLIQMYEEYDLTRNLSLLPNFAFSYAFAKFSTGLLEEANKALRAALIAFPSLLIALTEKCGADIDSSIRSHSFFDPVTYLKQSPPLNQLIALYVGRCFTMWKQPEILDWLVENAKFIVDNFDKYKEKTSAAENRRNTCFRFSPQNVLRHILTSDIKEAVECLPIEVRGQSVMTHDPLPPQDSVIGYERPQRLNTQGQDVNMLSLFLQSLMPSYGQAPNGNPNQELIGNAVQDHAAAAAAAAGHNGNEHGAAVADGARRLMDVMRDLLNTMTYRNDGEPPNPEGGGENNEEHDWED